MYRFPITVPIFPTTAVPVTDCRLAVADYRLPSITDDSLLAVSDKQLAIGDLATTT